MASLVSPEFRPCGQASGRPKRYRSIAPLRAQPITGNKLPINWEKPLGTRPPAT
ncbi:hypothetical protein SAMN05421854_10688 [Amycolatopsis rubida]|uniref:Uncharacterized protein n=1 Tax=Amycolatopsis rubida TaxID=112413 RepID=A0A1I5RVU2_9PSEU|nr:hypothetical protein SAMN05421854_10688 [Amycolatopsis rubida]